MDWLRRLFGRDGDVVDVAADGRKAAEVRETIVASDAARLRAKHAIADYRRLDDAADKSRKRVQAAGERIIDEIERKP